MIFKTFRGAGATGHVFFLAGGTANSKGLAYSGMFGPWTIIAVVPTTAQILPFAITAQTSDKQNVMVQGSVTVSLTPSAAVSKFDFTVNPKDGSYMSQWEQILNAKVTEQVLRAVLTVVKDLDIETATRSQKVVEDAVTKALGANTLSGDGVTISSCSIPKIKPVDSEVEKAIGSKERQEMLSASDKAHHDRRLKDAENDRAVREYEAETKLELERKNGALIDEQSANEQKKAASDAEATKIRMAPLADVDSGKLLGAAIMEAARNGQLGSMSITTELLAAVGRT